MDVGVVTNPGADVTPEGKIGLLVTSPRVPAGLMSYQAWSALQEAGEIWARSLSEPLAEVVSSEGFIVKAIGDIAATELADDLVKASGTPARLSRDNPKDVGHESTGDDIAAGETPGFSVVWLGSSDADPGLTDALATALSSLDSPPAVEVVVGSWDVPGSRLLDAVAVMDALRSPGGCPWDAEQTHSSLAPYLIEESFEVTEAIAEHDNANLREELGDVLLQVLFHARIAAERGDGFDIDGVAGELVEKMLRRHPHVFADGEASTAEEVEAEWAKIKAVEKPERDPNDILAGIPTGMPPLERAVKYVSRMSKGGQGDVVKAVAAQDSLGAAFLDLVVQAAELGQDPGAALRATLSDLSEASRTRVQSVSRSEEVKTGPRNPERQP